MSSMKRPNSQDSAEERVRLCRSLGFVDMGALHQTVAAAARQGAEALLKKKLDANTLQRLGYTATGMKKLGYSDSDMKRLGYFDKPIDLSRPLPAEPSEILSEAARRQLEQMVSSGCRANELRQAGFTLHHCRTAGHDARELAALGFTLNELAVEFDVRKLRRAGFGVRDLRGIFSGHELRHAGFSATDMRLAGSSVRDLLNFGYTENEARGAGFSTKELLREGISRHTVDKRRAQKYGED